MQVEQKTVQGLLQLIEAERRSDTVNRLLLQHLLRMLTALGIYEDAFQVPLHFRAGASGRRNRFWCSLSGAATPLTSLGLWS